MSKKTLYFDKICEYYASAVVEDDSLTEYYFEKAEEGSIVGNVYKGRVVNVLNGMQAAFIDCGLERNCYISVEDLFPDKNKYDGAEIDIPNTINLNIGDEIIVQVLKAPIGKKGARVTTNLSFVGKTIIFMPNTDFVGVSRKISDEELRKSLLFTAESMKQRWEGLVVRTAAPYINRGVMLSELEHMRRLYASVKNKFEKLQVGALLYTDASLPVRVLRDTINNEIDKIIVGNAELKEQIDLQVSLFSQSNIPVILKDDGKDLFYEEGLRKQLGEMISPKVQLENGAHLVIEKTEALTVIDVNTGKFIGDDSLEQTVYYTNILAAREIARQVKLRNIGGIVVVDFIDMADEKHRKALYLELKRALSTDKAKCTVLPMSQFGLIEFTRKRVGTNPTVFMTKPCNYCRTKGYTHSAELIIFDIRAKILNLLADGNKTVIVDLNFEIGNKLSGWNALVEDVKSRYPQARVYLVLHRTYHEEHYNLRCDSSPSLTLPKGAILLY